MKKFVAFVLVMAMAAVVSASPVDSIYVDYTITGNHCDVVFMQEAGNVNGSGGEITVAFDKAISNLSVENLAPSPDFIAQKFYGFSWGFEGTVGPVGETVLVQKIATAGIGTPGKDTDMNVVLPGVQPYMGTFGFGFDFDGKTEVQFTGLWDGIDTSTLNFIVPEPMTMSLLGLGGLVAARRRRA